MTVQESGSDDPARPPQPEETRTGGCLCGNIRFRVTGQSDYPHTCSCRHCQKLSGGPMMSWVSFPLAGLTWLGSRSEAEPKSVEPAWFYTFPHETKRGFCPVCGSQLCALDDGGDSIAITLSALDDASGLDPVNQSFREDGVTWLPAVPDRRASATSARAADAADRSGSVTAS